MQGCPLVLLGLGSACTCCRVGPPAESLARASLAKMQITSTPTLTLNSTLTLSSTLTLTLPVVGWALHGESLARPGLAVGEDADVVPVQEARDDGLEGCHKPRMCAQTRARMEEESVELGVDWASAGMTRTGKKGGVGGRRTAEAQEVVWRQRGSGVEQVCTCLRVRLGLGLGLGLVLGLGLGLGLE